MATRITQATELTATDVIHRRFTALPASATVGEVRDWFAASAHRRMAFLADDGRYVGSLTLDDLQAAEADLPAAEISHYGPTVAPDAPASVGSELALLTDARRVPVVDGHGKLLGVVSVTDDLARFCGT